MWSETVEKQIFSKSGISSQSARSVKLVEIVLASNLATLHDFMTLSYAPARALE
jgi:hypothetical protein